MSETITFNEIPAAPNLQRPGSYLEVRPDYSRLGILPIPARVLIVAQKLTGGTAVANQVYENITRPQQGTALGGGGSQIDRMVTQFLASNQTIPLDVVCVSDAGGATAASGTLTLGGTAWTAGWTYAFSIGGVRYQVGLSGTDTPATAAIAAAAVVNADTHATVTAAQGGVGHTGDLVCTAKNAGAEGNNIGLVVSPASTDSLPPGVTCTIVQMTGGATNPSIASAITAINGLWYTGFAIPWQDAPNLSALHAELSRRFNAMTRLDGKAYVGFTGTFSALLTKNGNTNSQYIYPIDLPVNSGSPPWEWAASLAGVGEDKLTQDPARQLGGLVLPGIVGPQRVDLLDDEEQELMLEGGGSTFHVLRDGTVTIGRVVSCYLTNAQGVNDPAFHDIMEIAVATRIRYDWRTYFRLTYPSNKLAPDGSLAAEYDTTVCTPNRAKGSWSGRHMLYAKQGWVINEVANARASVFVIDPNDKNRLNYSLPYDRIGNLMVDAGVLEFQV